MKKKISIVVCCFNESDCISFTIDSITREMLQLNYDFEILIVDDGSSDTTLDIVKKLTKDSNYLFYIEFSRNFGKDSAMLAGIQYASGDGIVTIDADMQHPPELIKEMILLWEQGYDVVYTYRENKNQHAGLMNRVFSKMFYKTLNSLSDMEMENGISDYRLLDKKVGKMLSSLIENNLFFRGLIKWVGFKQVGIPYTPNARSGGETKYNVFSLARLALQGITSFSIKPLYVALYLGFAFAGCSLLYIPYAVYSLMYGHPISGWSSMIVTIAFFGGLQLSILGIIGIYIGKIFMQTKQRPNYIVRSTNISDDSRN